MVNEFRLIETPILGELSGKTVMNERALSNSKLLKQYELTNPKEVRDILRTLRKNTEIH